ncbi:MULTISPECIES: LLM class flavin-dependent oxidoreductase [unclassified Crossiella]|uniref:LLM class flavin-dependent oxidoreductase n=1 Tax=unclassified Crossiella TaxID=2620835 RepID=UPI001FFF2EF6|nr:MULTISPECIES: LLM class flavin-dependent oxidoreductase [unclassified Crossiella]MCK2239143.1 LLM class flavin-dependent oxidoreductase [Crossiella sp. S99.2]MCK2251288.1 LLM class flavin-dependent oxidoreductase [Crossiella sp. S99.1]
MTATTRTLGLDTFGDVPDSAGQPEGIRLLVEQGVHAELAGVDYFGIGEHHTAEMPLSAPDLVLAAIAARTRRIRLGSAVTVLSTDDPVRVFQRYATLDALSGGRAEVILGRGSSTESFPLFGFDLADYDELFAEKADLFALLREEKPVTWTGRFRPALDGVEVFPHTTSGALPTWIGVGGTPLSVVRAAQHGLSLMLAIISGPAARFRPFAELYRQTLQHTGRPDLPIGVHSPGHLADTDQIAREEFFPHYLDAFGRAARQRGFRPPTRESYDQEVGPRGALYVGSPETVATKIAATLRQLGATRFDLKYGMAGLGHESLLHAIDLYGREVAPRVRALLSTH